MDKYNIYKKQNNALQVMLQYRNLLFKIILTKFKFFNLEILNGIKIALVKESNFLNHNKLIHLNLLNLIHSNSKISHFQSCFNSKLNLFFIY